MPSLDQIGRIVDPVRLRLIVEVGRRGSISAAAEAVGIGQPAASAQLGSLERALGHRLVERDGRRSRLTEAGQVVAECGARALGAISEALDELDALGGVRRGTIQVAASTTPGAYILPDILSCFRERFPGVQIRASMEATERVLERVRRREAHLGLVGEGGSSDRLVRHRILDDELVGIAPPGAIATLGGRASVEDLAEHTVLVREAGSSTREVAERYLLRAGFTARATWELDSNEAIKRAVRAGLGIGFLSALTVAEEVARGELEEFRLGGAQMRRGIFLVHVDDRELTPGERAFIETVFECSGAGRAPRGRLPGGGRRAEVPGGEGPDA